MLGVAGILLLGIGAQWLAWRLRLPSILLLLLAGFVVGPFTNHRLLDPDAYLGAALLPFVSIAVALILLEGGLTLRLKELRGGERVVRNLVLIGSPVTWALATVFAHYVLDFDWRLSFLLGAILIVTGPTVIIPLLRHVRPSGAIGAVVRWEGIVTDPVGAILAVLVFQVMLIPELGEMTTVGLIGLAKAVFGGGIIGGLGALILVVVLRKNLVPDFLHNGVSIAIGVFVFVLSNALQHESGLLAVTWMGILLANQDKVAVEHIVEFKENLRVLLISSLFIILAARLPMSEFTRFDLRTLGFVALLVLVVRPLSVFLSTIGTSTSFAERIFVAWMAPRGIVAAAVASVFALELEQANYPGADRLVSVVFAVIVLTVCVYGLTAGPLARRLGISDGQPRGVLFVGAHSWIRDMARVLEKEDVPTMLVDTSHREIRTAQMEGFRVHFGSILSEEFEDTVSLDGIGHLACMTHNDGVNALACLQFAPIFGRASIFQIAASEGGGEEAIPKHLSGRVLFDAELDYWTFEARVRAGGVVKRTRITEEYTFEHFLTAYEDEQAPPVVLFVIDGDGQLAVSTAQDKLVPVAGDTLIALVVAELEQDEVSVPARTKAMTSA